MPKDARLNEESRRMDIFTWGQTGFDTFDTQGPGHAKKCQ